MDYELGSAEIIHQEVVFVTPHVAESLLKNCSINRKINKRKVTQFVEMMESNQWQLTHQGLAITRDGKLIDGQHRLSAVIRSGMTIQFYIFTYDTTDANALSLPFDMGIPRSHATVLQLDPYKSRVAKCIAQMLFTDPGIVRFQKIMSAFENELDWFYGGTHTKKRVKIYSARGVETAVILRKAMGIDWYDQWEAMCDTRADLYQPTTRILVRYLEKVGKIMTISDKVAFVATWKATDPAKKDMVKMNTMNINTTLAEVRRWLADDRGII